MKRCKITVEQSWPGEVQKTKHSSESTFENSPIDGYVWEAEDEVGRLILSTLKSSGFSDPQLLAIVIEMFDKLRPYDYYDEGGSFLMNEINRLMIVFNNFKWRNSFDSHKVSVYVQNVDKAMERSKNLMKLDNGKDGVWRVLNQLFTYYDEDRNVIEKELEECNGEKSGTDSGGGDNRSDG